MTQWESFNLFSNYSTYSLRKYYLEICLENVFCRMALDIVALKELGTG